MKAVRAVLDRTAAAGRSVDLWWRDDDAAAATPSLDSLLALAGSHSLPVALAVVPGEAGPDLAARLRDEPAVDLLVHGWRHENHEPPGTKSAEFGPARDAAALAADAKAGLGAAHTLFGDRAMPVFVPPWNRLAPDGPAILAATGYRGLSVFGHRPADASIAIVNTHLDPVDWRGGRGPVPAERLAHALESALPGGEPVGLLTHHLMADVALWSAIGEILDVLAGHPAVRWTRARDLWPARPSLNRRQFDDLTSTVDARGGSTA